MRNYKCQARLLRAIAHPVRLQILDAVAHGSACVCDLMILTGRRQPYISQHLIVLRKAGLVRAEREGLNIRYYLAELDAVDLLRMIDAAAEARVDRKAPRTIRATGEFTMSDSSTTNTWHGIPRSEIEWFPTVVADRCIGCGMCVTSCGRGVYAFDYEANKPVVAAPQMCMVGCTTCAFLCPEDAIEFPSRGYIRQLIKKNKLLRQSKDTLRANREKYDVRLRQPMPTRT